MFKRAENRSGYKIVETLNKPGCGYSTSVSRCFNTPYITIKEAGWTTKATCKVVVSNVATRQGVGKEELRKKKVVAVNCH